MPQTRRQVQVDHFTNTHLFVSTYDPACILYRYTPLDNPLASNFTDGTRHLLPR